MAKFIFANNNSNQNGYSSRMVIDSLINSDVTDFGVHNYPRYLLKNNFKDIRTLDAKIDLINTVFDDLTDNNFELIASSMKSGCIDFMYDGIEFVYYASSDEFESHLTWSKNGYKFKMTKGSHKIEINEISKSVTRDNIKPLESPNVNKVLIKNNNKINYNNRNNHKQILLA